jgi:polyhydroxyalkanoate synthesis regulator phasin
MAGLFEKGLLTGLGLLEMSREKIEELIGDLEKRGEMSRQDASAFVNNALERGRKEKDLLEEKVKGLADQAFARMNLATREDLARLEQRLARIEKLLAAAKGEQ